MTQKEYEMIVKERDAEIKRARIAEQQVKDLQSELAIANERWDANLEAKIKLQEKLKEAEGIKEEIADFVLMYPLTRSVLASEIRKFKVGCGRVAMSLESVTTHEVSQVQILPPNQDYKSLTIRLERTEGALKKIANREIKFPDYDWSDWNGHDAQCEATNLIAQFAELSLKSISHPSPDGGLDFK
jgi:hypothetical protein